MIAEEYPLSKAILGAPLKIIENVVVRLFCVLTFLEGPTRSRPSSTKPTNPPNQCSKLHCKHPIIIYLIRR